MQRLAAYQYQVLVKQGRPEVADELDWSGLSLGASKGQRKIVRLPWVRDADRPVCVSCRVAFSALRRRHHCRFCSDVFCSKCCAKKITIPELGYREATRVCLRCFGVLSEVRSGIEDGTVSKDDEDSMDISFSDLYEIQGKDEEEEREEPHAYDTVLNNATGHSGSQRGNIKRGNINLVDVSSEANNPTQTQTLNTIASKAGSKSATDAQDFEREKGDDLNSSFDSFELFQGAIVANARDISKLANFSRSHSEKHIRVGTNSTVAVHPNADDDRLHSDTHILGTPQRGKSVYGRVTAQELKPKPKPKPKGKVAPLATPKNGFHFELSDKIWVHILSFLSAHTLLKKVCLLSRRFLRLSRDSRVWFRLYRAKFQVSSEFPDDHVSYGALYREKVTRTLARSHSMGVWGVVGSKRIPQIKSDCMVKVAVMGPPHSGKTELLWSLLFEKSGGKSQSQSQASQSNVCLQSNVCSQSASGVGRMGFRRVHVYGDGFAHSELDVVDLKLEEKHCMVKLEFWNTCLSQPFAKVLPMYIKGAGMVLVVLGEKSVRENPLRTISLACNLVEEARLAEPSVLVLFCVLGRERDHCTREIVRWTFGNGSAVLFCDDDMKEVGQDLVEHNKGLAFIQTSTSPHDQDALLTILASVWKSHVKKPVKQKT